MEYVHRGGRAGGLPGRSREFRLHAAGLRRDNQDKAEEMGKRFLFGGGFSHFARPEWMFPSGIQLKGSDPPLGASVRQSESARQNHYGGGSNGSTEAVDIQAAKKALYADYDQWQKNYQMIAGTPKNVIPKLRKVLEVLRPGIFSFWLDGPIPSADRISCLKLLAEEVVPALREISRELEPGRSVPAQAGVALASSKRQTGDGGAARSSGSAQRVSGINPGRWSR